MGLGGIITGLMGATGNSPKNTTPNAGQVNYDYGNLLNTYLGSQGQIYGNEAQYEPKYTQLALQQQSMARRGTVADATALGPGIRTSLRGYDPSAAGILDNLGLQANQQLALNGGLDPATLRTVQQSVRSSQAARGLGYGPGDAAQEQFYQTQTMEQRRAANQAFAGQVAGEQQQFYRDPYSIMSGIAPVSNTPSLLSPQQSDQMLGTAYNANAATDIGNQNAKLAMLQGFNSFS